MVVVGYRWWIGEENVQEVYIGACAGGLYWSKSNTVLLLANTWQHWPLIGPTLRVPKVT